MYLSKKEKLLVLGSSLYLLGLEVDGEAEAMEKLLAQGVPLSDPKMQEANRLYTANSIKFSQMEAQYLALKKELEEAGELTPQEADSAATARGAGALS